MKKPDAALHNQDPAYLRELVARTGLTREAWVARLGFTDRTLRHYLSGGSPIPYTVQYAAECLASGKRVKS